MVSMILSFAGQGDLLAHKDRLQSDREKLNSFSAKETPDQRNLMINIAKNDRRILA
jgi:hypothetical protein